MLHISIRKATHATEKGLPRRIECSSAFCPRCSLRVYLCCAEDKDYGVAGLIPFLFVTNSRLYFLDVLPASFFPLGATQYRGDWLFGLASKERCSVKVKVPLSIAPACERRLGHRGLENRRAGVFCVSIHILAALDELALEDKSW